MVKKTTNPNATTKTNDEGDAEMQRTPGDGSRMLTAAELAAEHGQDVLDANAAAAARIRSTKG